MHGVYVKPEQMGKTDYSSFNELTFEDFRKRARDFSLSANEKIGFPDSYRKGFDKAIAANIYRLLPAFEAKKKTIIDIGCGCSELAGMLIHKAEKQGHTLVMADSDEMLAHLPKSKAVRKVGGLFPKNLPLFNSYRGKADAILVYSVMQHVILEGSIYSFIDAAISLLAPGGALLLADIPNITKRNRFFSSDAGVAFHRKFTGTKTKPELTPPGEMQHKLDDGAVFGILQRYRNFGCETYLVPQPESLPMHNRREDILIVKW